MKIKSIEITDFRHFTHLTVGKLPETARLIVLVGPNGCGKSSFLEALYVWYQWTSAKNQYWDQEYHAKQGSVSISNSFHENVRVETHDSLPRNNKKMVYVRSAYRNETEFRARKLSRLNDLILETRINRLIDNDPAVSRNYERIVARALEDIFEEEDAKMSLNKFRNKVLGDIRMALDKLFPELQLDDLGNPLEDGTFRFTKGISKGYTYKNLSGGEKAAFDLVLDLIMAVRKFDNTIFCIDEPESHMNTKLQSKLLKVLYEIVPDNCQLIVATHSIGMMRQAQDIEKDDAGSVIFLDFTDQCFDSHQNIVPTKPSREFWKQAYSVALDDISQLLAPSYVVICEGDPNPTNFNHSHDARCYDRIFKDEFPETQFVSAGSAEQILVDQFGLINTLRNIVEGIKVIRVIDRDSRSLDRIKELKRQDVRVLGRRNLESYLYDDEVLSKLANAVGKPDKADELILAKQKIVEERKRKDLGDASDDLKPASGEIYNICKRILELSNPGNDAREFARDTLSPIIQPGMHVYSELKKKIFEVD